MLVFLKGIMSPLRNLAMYLDARFCRYQGYTVFCVCFCACTDAQGTLRRTPAGLPSNQGTPNPQKAHQRGHGALRELPRATQTPPKSSTGLQGLSRNTFGPTRGSHEIPRAPKGHIRQCSTVPNAFWLLILRLEKWHLQAYKINGCHVTGPAECA